MRSKHPGDILKWLEKIVNSCTDVRQLFVAKRCITYFEKTYQPQDSYLYKTWRLKQKVLYKIAQLQQSK